MQELLGPARCGGVGGGGIGIGGIGGIGGAAAAVALGVRQRARRNLYQSCMNGGFFDRTFRSVQVDELSYDDDFVDAAELLIDYHYRAQGRGQRVTTVSY